ncbi:MAG: BadF/BadG/BcrA/BcrD ATPase family protein [Verrucomicrobiota bacterium]
MDLILGVDGGGTQTRSVITDISGNILGRGWSGASNPNTTTLESLSQHLSESIHSALRQASAKISDLKAACLGVAGSSHPEARKKVLKALEAVAFSKKIQFEIITDAEAALYGAHLGGHGIVVISGTGSVCFGRDLEGQLHRSGGHGPQENDGGSAVWIHQELIKEKVELSKQLGAKTKATSVICQLVFESAEKGNTEALQLVNAAASELRKLVKDVDQLCALENGPLSLVGGTLFEGSILRRILSQQIEQSLPHIKNVRPKLLPVEGAALMAFRHLYQRTDKSTLKNDDRFIANLGADRL